MAAEASARFFLTPILSLRNSLRENGMFFRQFPAVSFTARSWLDLIVNLSALATSKAWSRVNAAREIVAAGVSGEW